MGAVSILEREVVRQAITAALDDAHRGQSTTLILVGDAGMGKTTLVHEACSMARTRGVTLTRARCSDVEASIPFGMIDRVFDDLGPGALSPEGSGRSPTDVLAARYARLVDWLRCGAITPLLIAVDDLQWADPDSTTLLAALCRRLDGAGVVVLAATRPWPSLALDQARRLVHDGLARLENLNPLSEDASRALLHARLGEGLCAEFATRAHHSCAGNPLLLTEVADAWGRGDDLLAYPGALGERLFLPRFTGVGPEALRWARGASILGSRFRPLLVAALVGQHDLEASAALRELCDARIVRATASGDAEFAHPLLRDALYNDMALPVRQGLHARVVTLLQGIGASCVEVAVHAIAADLRGDPLALEAVVSSARVALAAGAAATAVEQFSSATQLAGEATPSSVWLELGRACLVAARIDQGEVAARRFLADSSLDDAERVVGLRLLAQILMASAHHVQATQCFEEASALARRFDPTLAAEVLLDLTFVSSVREGPRRARATTQRVRQMIEHDAITDDGLRHAARSAETFLACLGGELDGIEEMATSARRLVARPDLHESTSAWNSVFGYVRLAKILERFDDDLAAFRVFENLTRRQGAIVAHWSYTVNHADTLWRIGRLEDAYASLHEGIAVAEVLPTIAPRASVGLAYIAHELGRRHESAAWVEQVEALMATFGETAYLRLWLLLIAARDELSDGRVDAALRAARRAAATARESGILEPCVVPWHGVAIEAHVAAGRLDDAWELATSLDLLCEPLPCHAPRAVAAAGRASVEWRRGHVRAAEDLYEEALAHNAAVAMPLAAAETLIAFGRFLRHTGRVTRSRAVLHHALEVLEPTGAGRLRRLATQELASAGGRAPRRRDRAAGELTAQEYRVCSLAAKGLTNKEIAQQLYVAAKTVDHHLSAVYAKLGISSRRELMLNWRDDVDRADPERT